MLAGLWYACAEKLSPSAHAVRLPIRSHTFTSHGASYLQLLQFARKSYHILWACPEHPCLDAPQANISGYFLNCLLSGLPTQMPTLPKRRMAKGERHQAEGIRKISALRLRLNHHHPSRCAWRHSWLRRQLRSPRHENARSHCHRARNGRAFEAIYCSDLDPPKHEKMILVLDNAKYHHNIALPNFP